MFKRLPHAFQQALKRIVHALLKVSSLRFAVLFLVVAVVVSVMIVMAIDLLWDGRLNAELEFAGVLTPFLDGLFLAVFVIAMLDEIREEVARRQEAEAEIRSLNTALEAKVQERTQQLLAAQEELVRKEKLALLSQVADTFGHELRNPLGVMNNAVYFLQTVLADADASTLEYLGIIKDEIANAEHIKDSGGGIAPEHLGKLFQPLFTTKARRIGLGLVVVKKLTEVNGGTVAVHSEPKKGATFTLVLPV